MNNSFSPVFALKIDVDTERGTREGVMSLASLLQELKIPATFFFALGPDNTGRALKRIFRRGFLKKVSRTSVLQIYGLRTLLNGLLWPGPKIAKRHADLMREVQKLGFSVGIHCYDHERWQDGVSHMSEAKIQEEFSKACEEFKSVFGAAAKSAAAPGWQANAKTLAAYDIHNLTYASDSRGVTPFFPKVGTKVFQTLQIPTTLPTLDELLGLPEYPLKKITSYLISLLRDDVPNVMTIHAELEGMFYLDWFRSFLMSLQKRAVVFSDLDSLAQQILVNKNDVPVAELIQGSVAGRSGKLAMQGT